MINFRQPVLALALALICGSIVLGSVSLSFLESGYTLAQGNPQPFLLVLGVPVLDLVRGRSEAPMQGMTIGTPVSEVVLVTSEPTVCASIPSGWNKIVLGPDDTLAAVSGRFGVTVEALKQGNCLVVDLVKSGSEIFVPPLPMVQAKPTRLPCTPRQGWVHYPVRFGDTLYNLGARVGASVAAIMEANCLSSANIYTGQMLLLPYYPAVAFTAVPPQLPPVIILPSPFPPVPQATPLATPWLPPPTSATPLVTASLPPFTSATPLATPWLPSPTPITPFPTSTVPTVAVTPPPVDTSVTPVATLPVETTPAPLPTAPVIEATPVPPTQVPPTQAPPTQAPPTQAPPTPVPPTQPPPDFPPGGSQPTEPPAAPATTQAPAPLTQP